MTTPNEVLPTVRGIAADIGERALKSFAGALLLFFGSDRLDVLHADWVTALSLAAGAAVISVLFSVGSLPFGKGGTASLTASVIPTAVYDALADSATQGRHALKLGDAYATISEDAPTLTGGPVDEEALRRYYKEHPPREFVVQGRLETALTGRRIEINAEGTHIVEPAPTFKLGRLPNDPSKPRVRLTALEVPGLAYNPPASVDWYSKVPANSWGMDGNDAVGDCTCAEIDHGVKTLQVAAGNPEVVSTKDEVLAVYSAVTGWKASDPNTDRGAMMQDVRNYWRKHGITLGGRNHTILLFAQVDHRDHNLVKWCIARFGEVGLGFAFPDSAMGQFNAGQPWTVVKGDPAPTEGHAVGAVGYDADFVYVTTWGRVQKMAWAFFDAYVDEAWTQLSEEFVSATSGNDPLAETAYQLGQQYAAVTGQKNPIPAPSPTPAPSPAPTPHVGFPFAEWEAWKAHPRSVPKARALIVAITAWLAGGA